MDKVGCSLDVQTPVDDRRSRGERLNRLPLQGRSNVSTHWYLYFPMHNIEKIANVAR